MPTGRSTGTNAPAGVHLVTGASGFIGRVLVRQLLDRGTNVRILSRNGVPGLEDETQNVAGDILDLAAVERAVKDVDVVYHLAGVGSPATSNDWLDTMYRVNVVGTHHVLQAAHQAGVRRVIVASSAAVYGQIDSDSISEDDPLEPASTYGLTKIAQEQACELYSRVHGLETLALRLFNVYGAGDDPHGTNGKLIPMLLRRMTSGEAVSIFGDGGQTRDFIHVDDVGQAFVSAGTAPWSGFTPLNVGTGKATSISEVISTISRALGVEPEIDRRPARQGEVQHSIADISRVQRSLGFRASTAFEESIASMVRSETTRVSTGRSHRL